MGTFFIIFLYTIKLHNYIYTQKLVSKSRVKKKIPAKRHACKKKSCTMNSLGKKKYILNACEHTPLPPPGFAFYF